MKTDIVTRSAAALGLITGAIHIIESPRDGEVCPVFLCGGEWEYLDDAAFAEKTGTPARAASVIDYLRFSDFDGVVEAVASVFGDLSLKAPDAYEAIMDGISNRSGAGLILCKPNPEVWPDIFLQLIPEAANPGYFDNVRRRCYPALSALELLAFDNVPPDLEDDWCAQNPQALSRIETGDAVRWTGWCSELERPVSVTAAVHDMRIPWTIRYVGGREYVSPVTPLVRADEALNYWTPDPAYVREQPEEKDFD